MRAEDVYAKFQRLVRFLSGRYYYTPFIRRYGKDEFEQRVWVKLFSHPEEVTKSVVNSVARSVAKLRKHDSDLELQDEVSTNPPERFFEYADGVLNESQQTFILSNFQSNNPATSSR